MPWRLDGLVEDRLERCRLLLAEPGGECEGCADMRNWVEYADAIVALHRTALDGSCRPRRDLSLGEKLQLCCLFVTAISKHPMISLGVEPIVDPVLHSAATTLPPEWQAVSLAVNVCGEYGGFGHAGYQNKVRVKAALEQMFADPEAAEQLPVRLAAAGSSCALTAATILRAANYRCVKAALAVCREADEMGMPAPAFAVEGAQRAADRLVALAPAWPRYLLVKSEVALLRSDMAAAAAVLRTCLEAAKRQKAHYWASQAGLELAMAKMAGGEGPRLNVAEVQALLDESEVNLRKAKPWASLKVMLKDIAEAREDFEGCVRCAPRGAQEIPASLAVSWTPENPHKRELRCDGCGQKAVELKKCSKCRAVSYCGRECQLSAWRNGHKKECAKLAQQRAGR